LAAASMTMASDCADDIVAFKQRIVKSTVQRELFLGLAILTY
jgi:hypothetical protein